MTRPRDRDPLSEYSDDHLAPPSRPLYADPYDPPIQSPEPDYCKPERPEVPYDPPIQRPNPVKPPTTPTEPSPAATNWPLFILACLILAGVLILLFTTCTKGPQPGSVNIDFKPVLNAIEGVNQNIKDLTHRIPRAPDRPGRPPRLPRSELDKKQAAINWLYKVKAEQAATIKKLQQQLKNAQKSGIDLEQYKIEAAYRARQEYLRIFLNAPFKPGDGERVLCFSDGEPCYVRDRNGTKKTILPFN